MITDEECRDVAAELRRQIGYMSERSKWYEDDIDVIECGNAAYRNIAASVERRGNAFQGNYIHIVERLADLIDRPTCHLIEDQDGRTACSECGCTALYMSDATYCPDCGGMIVDD